MAFVVLFGSTVSQATINAKPLNFIGNLVSLSVFLFLGKVAILIGIIMGLGQILGAFIGSHLVVNKGAKIIKPVFIIVVISIRDLCINMNNHQKSTFHPLGNFLNPALALLG
ncbi:Putative membrane protein YfcA [Bathymodiolus heckerae thiotrophic gill symbiont]|nr:TSUP family transporter [Bathymodiolus heckerae thiotrophic gill symbiont]SMN13251.1 Putative membrane protein YfcA [Bathymodiolus heckerae thiotrophic gill symbiont]